MSREDRKLQIFAMAGSVAITAALFFLVVRPHVENVPEIEEIDIETPVEVSIETEEELGAPSVKSLLQGKNVKERATIKGREIAKRVEPMFVSRDDYTVAIASFEAIEGGVQYFVRAWDDKGQIGFGEDGTVDIERFRVYNPPILVPDGTKDEEGRNNYREDLQEASLQVLEHTIKVIPKHGAENIQIGKIGNTVSTFFPAAGANSPVDGFSAHNDSVSNGTSWADRRDGAGNFASATSSVAIAAGIGAGNNETTSKWSDLRRGFFLFDTSAIDDADEISAATLSLKSDAQSADGLSISPKINIYTTTPAANDNIVAGDYGNIGTTAQSDTAITMASWDASEAYNDFVLNATGIGNVSKTGISKFGSRESEYDAADVEPTWSNSATSNFFSHFADVTGTTEDPKLVVTHAGAVTFVPLIIIIE